MPPRPPHDGPASHGGHSRRRRLAMEKVAELYARLDAEVASVGSVCESRGVCCDFEKADHVLYASTIELDYVRELHPRPFSGDSPHCPFWIDGLCFNRERRPLGCRTYFCDPTHRERLEAIHERYLAELRRIARSEELDWRYEPFVAALRRADASPGADSPSSEQA